MEHFSVKIDNFKQFLTVQKYMRKIKIKNLIQISIGILLYISKVKKISSESKFSEIFFFLNTWKGKK